MSGDFIDYLLPNILKELDEYAVIVVDPNGFIKSWNLGAELLLGYKAEEILNKHASTFYTEEDKKNGKTKELFNTAVTKHKAFDKGIRVKKDKSTFIASVSITAIHNPLNEIIGFTIIARDITIEELTENRCRVILESSPSGIIVVNKAGHITNTNQKTSEIFGYSEAELVGNMVEMLIPDNYKSNHQKHRENYNKNPKEIIMDDNSNTFYGKRKNGDIFPIDISVSPMVGYGDDLFSVVNIRDSSKRKALTDDLIKTKAQIKMSEQIKSSFLATMNHELKTPLHHILGFSDFIADKSKDKEVLEYAKIINESGNELLTMVEDIFTLAMLEHHDIPLRKGILNLSELRLKIKTITVDLLAKSGKNTLINLNFIIPDLPLLLKNIITDKYKVIQVVTNIINNAIKFTERGEIDITISSPKKECLCISIQDSGIGIDMENQTSMFQYFNQLDNSATREYRGIGTGLTISNKIAQVLKGKISVTSEVGKGTNFTFTFPFDEEV